MDLVFATNNQHKLLEVQAMVGKQFTIKSLADIGCYEDIPETGNTFQENAKQKSDFLVEHYQVNCFSDDSGLEIDALNGEPGVYSARYSGSRDMQENIALVLERLKGVEQRTERFRTVISLMLDGRQYFFQGAVEGRIIDRKLGEDGFGYDPIFIPEGYQKTFAQMSMEEKNKFSHRKKATSKLIEFLQQKLANS